MRILSKAWTVLQEYFYSHLEAAKEKEDKEAACQILAIIRQEIDKQFWRQMSFALGRPKRGACFWVQVKQGEGMTTEYTGQEELHKAIWDNIH